ncbi:hypothetical protein E5D57_007284 [Metarhizium anisopliae]|nr:hypothetical protein E5D57_007284 [Metarhizium anisopliae]
MAEPNEKSRRQFAWRYGSACLLRRQHACSEDAGRPAMIHIGRIYRLSTGYEVTIKIVRDTPTVDAR